ncbi:diguanylate cyclase/phosphodiesterase [Psychromonas ingrahamii 37]|uniref:Diguanylate cyclase/phosphodiesterase n=1 Tax=Psychromonas ingrahamii (strain DSM 17664 / CCUG 51855 / 37) TaxID=357804 RepID=A1SUA4_PSYIN|nr:EAL domain-containing protein [Psychromonas ingrahamii]ABM03069.1 diguanylate cyclase/phosphodiesterase [Psychromonas ingrahamii 37]
MTLRKKIRYIILPVIIALSAMISLLYYHLYKNQIIENKITLLNGRLENQLLHAEYQLDYVKSYLRQKIESKEASLIFNAKQGDNNLSAPDITAFLNLFVNRKNSANKSNHVINDFVIFDSYKKLIVHINTRDPFAKPMLKTTTKAVLDQIFDQADPNKKISQYHYFLDDPYINKMPSLYIIQAFSRYQLSSKLFYESNEDTYLAQAQLDLNFFTEEIRVLIDENNGYFNYRFINKNTNADNFSFTSTPFQVNDNGAYEGRFGSSLFDIILTLDKNYFAEQLNNLIATFLLLNFIVIILSYLLLIWLIDQQIILPITKLAKSIKEVEASLVVELKPLTTKDEVADLNESYISLINKINTLANNDSLTGLANRGSFNEKLSAIMDARQKNKTYVALFFIDLDNFKYVNDTFGHDTGDRLLVVFSQRLQQLLRAEDNFISGNMIDSIARLGGDEFVILMNGLPSIETIESIGKRICDLFHNGFRIGEEQFDVHASIGIAYSNDHQINGEGLLTQADDAMYLAKRAGKNNFKLFSDEIKEKMLFEKNIENELIDAHRDNKLHLVFMPAYCAETRILRGYEILLRCPSLLNVGIGPDVFIPIAENTDLILAIDLWVAQQTVIRLKEVIHKNRFTGFFSFNVSSKSLRNDRFYTTLKEFINTSDINPKQLELEITETCLMPDDHQAVASLDQLKSLGVRIALDDFGTGYTSFGQILNYPLDTLKIDRSFVTDLRNTPVGQKPTLDIIFELAKAYQLSVIVEGIETQADFEHVKTLGCDIVQGFYFSNPRTWTEVLKHCGKLHQIDKRPDQQKNIAC